MPVTELNGGNYEELVNKGVVLIDFYGNNCPPCKRMAPHFESASLTFRSKVKFLKANAYDNNLQELAETFEISGLPTLVLLKDGEPLANKEGYQDHEGITEFINLNLKETTSGGTSETKNYKVEAFA